MRDTTSDDVGFVGEEAPKLLGALQDWVRESGNDYAGAAAYATGAEASRGDTRGSNGLSPNLEFCESVDQS